MARTKSVQLIKWIAIEIKQRRNIMQKLYAVAAVSLLSFDWVCVLLNRIPF